MSCCDKWLIIDYCVYIVCHLRLALVHVVAAVLAMLTKVSMCVCKMLDLFCFKTCMCMYKIGCVHVQ